MLKKWLVLFCTASFLLGACHSPVFNQAQGNVADTKSDIDEARTNSDDLAKPEPSVVVKDGSYVDTRPISLEKDPSWLRNRIVIRGDQLPFSYYSRTISSGANDNVLTKYQAGLDPSSNVSINYSGTVKGALDLIAAKTGYTYSISGNSIYWQAYVTKTFDIAFIPGDSDYMMGKKSSGGSSANTSQQGGQGLVSNYVSSDSSASEYSNLSAKLSVWQDLGNSIRQLLSEKGTVNVSQATTSITVRDKPSNMELISKFIENINKNLSKQVLIKVQVLEVNLENDFTFGINWNAVTQAFKHSPFTLNANYGTPISITPFTAQAGGADALPSFGLDPSKQSGLKPDSNTIPNYSVLLNALNQQGQAAIVSEPRVVCLNNQVSVVRIVTQDGYLASVQNTTTPSSSTTTQAPSITSQITPGTLITGITLYILPKIFNDKIYLQINADLSTSSGFTKEGPTGTNSTQIQLPHIIEKSFNQKSMIRSGETLILSGFRQKTNIARANQFIYSQALGGKGAQQLNKETIVLITPIVLSGNA